MIKISEATLDDVTSLTEIEKTIFQYDVISKKQIRHLIKSETALVVKAALYTTAIIGYLVLLRRRNSKVLRIYSLGVLPDYRNLGVGKQLLQKAEELSDNLNCECLQLEIQVQNKSALLFYLAAGYSLYGRKDGYYTDGSAALLLRKQLTSECLI
jgi:[ribosomal protein S18]-alanine N-acetyltransferase